MYEVNKHIVLQLFPLILSSPLIFSFCRAMLCYAQARPLPWRSRWLSVCDVRVLWKRLNIFSNFNTFW